MYDDLVKNLRNRRICVQSGGDLEKDFPLMKEAADAIEELIREIGKYKAAHIAEQDAQIAECERKLMEKEQEAHNEFLARSRIRRNEHGLF